MKTGSIAFIRADDPDVRIYNICTPHSSKIIDISHIRNTTFISISKKKEINV